MANRAKGETAITIDGKEYTLFLGTHEAGLLEEKMSTPEKDLNFFEIYAMVLHRTKVKAMEAWIWASLQKFHPEIATLRDAADLIDRAGGILAFGKQLAALQESARPDDADLKELGISLDPPKAQVKSGRTRRRGTGADSTSPLDASV